MIAQSHAIPIPWISFSVPVLVATVLSYYLLSKSHLCPNFSIIIDGGSTGTRIHVFAYRMSKGDMPAIDFGRSAAMRVSPGLSFFSGEQEGVGEVIRELVEFGKGRVPRDLWGDTEVRLMATAGLRLLDFGIKERILEACRKPLRSSGFRFRDDWAVVIPGADEGIYAWVAANYVLGTLGDEPQKTTGIIELGGASVQVAFVSSEPVPPEFSHVVNFGETTYNLYSHSFLHLGQNVAYTSLRELLISGDLVSSQESLQTEIFKDPCMPKGYAYGVGSPKISASAPYLERKVELAPHALGNFSECRSAALMLLQSGKEKCLYPSCNLGSASIPKLQGRFIATENFFHTFKFFGLGPASFLSDLMLAGEQFCEEDWSKLKEKYHALDEEDLLQYCFSSAYIVALLHDSLGIDMKDDRIVFTNMVGDIPLDWALGAFIMQASLNPTSYHQNWISAIVCYVSGSLSLCFILALSVLMVWSVLRR